MVLFFVWSLTVASALAVFTGIYLIWTHGRRAWFISLGISVAVLGDLLLYLPTFWDLPHGADHIFLVPVLGTALQVLLLFLGKAASVTESTRGRRKSKLEQVTNGH